MAAEWRTSISASARWRSCTWAPTRTTSNSTCSGSRSASSTCGFTRCRYSGAKSPSGRRMDGSRRDREVPIHLGCRALAPGDDHEPRTQGAFPELVSGAGSIVFGLRPIPAALRKQGRVGREVLLIFPHAGAPHPNLHSGHPWPSPFGRLRRANRQSCRFVPLTGRGKRKRRPEGGVWRKLVGSGQLLGLIGYPVHGVRHLFVGERRVAALRRHEIAVGAVVEIGRASGRERVL